MHSYRSSVSNLGQTPARRERQATKQNQGERRPGCGRLRAVAAVLLTLTAAMPPGSAQQAGAGSKGPDKAASELPVAPTPAPTEPYPLRTSSRDYSKPFASWLRNPINVYRPTTISKASFANSVRLADLVKDGKIYLSLSDAIALAIENNYDIAIARYDLDIADTDILRTETGAAPLGAPRPSFPTLWPVRLRPLSTGGGPGGTSVGSGGAGSGVQRTDADHSGRGPDAGDPRSLRDRHHSVGARQRTAVKHAFFRRQVQLTTNTDEYNFTFNQGFVTGTNLQRRHFKTPASQPTIHSPITARNLTSIFKATVTQHLLQGAGIWVNKRFIYQALNDRRITDSSFRQQILLHRQPGGEHLLGPGAGI